MLNLLVLSCEILTYVQGFLVKATVFLIFPLIILLFLSVFISNYGKPQLTKMNQNVQLIKQIPKPILMVSMRRNPMHARI